MWIYQGQEASQQGTVQAEPKKQPSMQSMPLLSRADTKTPLAAQSSPKRQNESEPEKPVGQILQAPLRQNETRFLPSESKPIPVRPIASHPNPKKPDGPHPERKQRVSPASRDCILLAAAYLIGTLSAGVLQALSSAEETDMLRYYLGCWQSLFAVQDAGQVIRLFWVELVTLLGILSVFLFLGLSALGPFPIYLFTMLYGAGAGLLSVQILSPAGSLRTIFLAIFLGIPTAIFTAVLCLFGVSALRVSERLHTVSFGRGREGSGIPPKAACGLLRQFALACMALVPLCGVSACLACLESRLR